MYMDPVPWRCGSCRVGGSALEIAWGARRLGNLGARFIRLDKIASMIGDAGWRDAAAGLVGLGTDHVAQHFVAPPSALKKIHFRSSYIVVFVCYM